MGATKNVTYYSHTLEPKRQPLPCYSMSAHTHPLLGMQVFPAKLGGKERISQN